MILSGAQTPARVSATAEVIAALIPSLPQETVEDLGRLIQRKLTTTDFRGVRYARLGLLIDMVSATGTGEIPSTRDYNRARADAKGQSSIEWPNADSLSVAYGGWAHAVLAAMSIWTEGSSSRRGFSAHHHLGYKQPFRHDEACAALRKCAEVLGAWPTEFEYDDWRRASRQLALLAGQPYPRYPSLKVWKRLFGNWPAFETAARSGIH
jgi:hypothetical protein